MWYNITTKEVPMITFGEFIRKLRIEKDLTLRDFCRAVHLDPSNWSKTERGFSAPPKSRCILQGVAEVLNLKEGSEEYNTLFDLAAISYIPSELLGEQRMVEKLPVFFRTIRGEKPSREELEDLLNILRED